MDDSNDYTNTETTTAGDATTATAAANASNPLMLDITEVCADFFREYNLTASALPSPFLLATALTARLEQKFASRNYPPGTLADFRRAEMTERAHTAAANG